MEKDTTYTHENDAVSVFTPDKLDFKPKNVKREKSVI